MPYSIVLKVFPEEPFDLREATGVRLQAMLLDLIRQVDPALAIDLHDRPDQDEPTALRQYAVSPVFVEKDSRQRDGSRAARTVAPAGSKAPAEPSRLAAGTPCWLRVAALDDRVYPALMMYLLGIGKSEGASIRKTGAEASGGRSPSASLLPALNINQTRFQIVEVLASGLSRHPWVGYAEPLALVSQASETERRITLEFKSPVVFMRGKMEVPLPLPRLIWISLQDRWQDAFGDGFALPENFSETVEKHVAIVRHELRTQPFRQDEKNMLTGFVGRATFRILDEVPPEFIKAVNLLADFALYSGIGKKPTRGMGMVRRIMERG